ncbi:MAG: SDR family oxidoreductase [Lachnospiraceae bacterium]|nr:SDR family oxidoreductase [Lachnospiraceae bacterium]
MQTLKGRTCVFAGATAGDGVAAVKLLCAGGMNVIMMTHMAERAQKLVDEINDMQLPGRCIAVGALESGPAEEDPSTYERIAREFGSVDVLIANTGATGRDVPMEEVAPSDLMHSIEHLVGGAYGMLHAALPFLRRSRAPRVIFMTTVEGTQGGVHESFENAVAKGAVHSLTLNAAARLARDGITVNCISKGAIPRIEGVNPGDVDPSKMLDRIPMGRLGTPDDLGELICFLASEESSYITGQTIAVSGGLELLF